MMVCYPLAQFRLFSVLITLEKSIQIRAFTFLLGENEIELIDREAAGKLMPVAEQKAFGAIMPNRNIPVRIRKRERA
jgi:hypothetical protein